MGDGWIGSIVGVCMFIGALSLLNVVEINLFPEDEPLVDVVVKQVCITYQECHDECVKLDWAEYDEFWKPVEEAPQEIKQQCFGRCTDDVRQDR